MLDFFWHKRKVSLIYAYFIKWLFYWSSDIVHVLQMAYFSTNKL
uniref:Uncharacterized protein n=1 Tax=Rhizophora mucronata TaxID=61149 RepID=A0A2P2PAB0_RHIMU